MPHGAINAVSLRRRTVNAFGFTVTFNEVFYNAEINDESKDQRPVPAAEAEGGKALRGQWAGVKLGAADGEMAEWFNAHAWRA